MSETFIEEDLECALKNFTVLLQGWEKNFPEALKSQTHLQGAARKVGDFVYIKLQLGFEAIQLLNPDITVTVENPTDLLRLAERHLEEMVAEAA